MAVDRTWQSDLTEDVFKEVQRELRTVEQDLQVGVEKVSSLRYRESLRQLIHISQKLVSLSPSTDSTTSPPASLLSSRSSLFAPDPLPSELESVGLDETAECGFQERHRERNSQLVAMIQAHHHASVDEEPTSSTPVPSKRSQTLNKSRSSVTVQSVLAVTAQAATLSMSPSAPSFPECSREQRKVVSGCASPQSVSVVRGESVRFMQGDSTPKQSGTPVRFRPTSTFPPPHKQAMIVHFAPLRTWTHRSQEAPPASMPFSAQMRDRHYQCKVY